MFLGCAISNFWMFDVTRKHFSRMYTDRAVTRPSSERAAMSSRLCTDKNLWKHYIPLAFPFSSYNVQFQVEKITFSVIRLWDLLFANPTHADARCEYGLNVLHCLHESTNTFIQTPTTIFSNDLCCSTETQFRYTTKYKNVKLENNSAQNSIRLT